jgi:hypothetical protein
MPMKKLEFNLSLLALFWGWGGLFLYCGRYLIPTCLCFFSCQIMFLLFTELYKMVCDPDETDLNIHIPAVMLPQDAGTRLETMLMSTSSGALPS